MAGIMQVGWKRVENPTWDCDEECGQQSTKNHSLGFLTSRQTNFVGLFLRIEGSCIAKCRSRNELDAGRGHTEKRK